MTEPEEHPRPVNPLVPGLAVLGAALLAGGTFCPVVVLSSGEVLSYREFAWADGNVVLGAAAAAFALTWVFRWYRGLFAAGGVALFMTGATLLKVPRAGFAGAALGWGWLPLVAGGVLLLAAALVAERDRPREDADGPPSEDGEPFEDWGEG
ncbi:MAG TPA: hypothetical protein VFA26_18830 [Gemmataceae bacterium]|nr:hypothetical protein [Gemmataceae bacterium]